MDQPSEILQENLQQREELQQRIKALQEAQGELEKSVRRRTETLEIRNHVLQISQGILDVLPVVVFGIDPEQMIVHCNEYGRNLFPYGGIGPLGNDRYEVFPPKINELIDRLATERIPKATIEVGQQRFRGEVRRLHETLSEGIVLVLIPEA
ncbi:MAG: hypothetical protein KAU22_07365 [Desulfuromonadales bacterium]|nr:hypothetical protein [Desulfuromonadales bacterium]